MSRLSTFGDQIRFRFQSFIPGYLQVLNPSTDGDTVWLFRLIGWTQQLTPGQEYWIPPPTGALVVGGNPGYDVTYWTVSNAPIDSGSFSRPSPVTPKPLLPRCGEKELQSRSICADERAGVGPVREVGHLPLPTGARLASRELVFQPDGSSTSISALPRQHRTIVYEFRIAHR
jgi:hypothetical protein